MTMNASAQSSESAAEPVRRDILYVDDEIDNGVVFDIAFGAEFKVWTAASAEEAIRLLSGHEFPVIISDQRMPLMTGAELFRFVRQQYPRTKQIMLTGYSNSPDVTEAINKGQICWFQK